MEQVDLLAEVKELVALETPTFDVIVRDHVTIRGGLILEHPQTGDYLDRWGLAIALPDDYPTGLPIVREVGGRVPWIADRHVFKDGCACMFVPDAQWKHYPEGMTITEFLNGPVRNHYLAQTHFELTGSWPKAIGDDRGDRSHGPRGRLEYWMEELETASPRVVERFLDYLASDWVSGHRPCYCGSGDPLRRCHASTLALFRNRIGKRLAQDARGAIAYLNSTYRG